MKVLRRFYRYINPVIDPDVQHHMDRYSMRSIYYASIAVFAVETLLFLYAFLTSLGSLNRSAVVSLISVGCCVVMCFAASLLSAWSLRKKNLGRRLIEQNQLVDSLVIHTAKGPALIDLVAARIQKMSVDPEDSG